VEVKRQQRDRCQREDGAVDCNAGGEAVASSQEKQQRRQRQHTDDQVKRHVNDKPQPVIHAVHFAVGDDPREQLVGHLFQNEDWLSDR
jgi:hypothetical protein